MFGWQAGTAAQQQQQDSEWGIVRNCTHEVLVQVAAAAWQLYELQKVLRRVVIPAYTFRSFHTDTEQNQVMVAGLACLVQQQH